MDVPNISENVRTAREKAGLTQVELSKMTGISKGYISKIENNHTTANQISLYTAFNLAKAMNVSLDYLIGEKPIDQSEMEQIMLMLENESPDIREEFIRIAHFVLKRQNN